MLVTTAMILRRRRVNIVPSLVLFLGIIIVCDGQRCIDFGDEAICDMTPIDISVTATDSFLYRPTLVCNSSDVAQNNFENCTCSTFVDRINGDTIICPCKFCPANSSNAIGVDCGNEIIFTIPGSGDQCRSLACDALCNGQVFEEDPFNNNMVAEPTVIDVLEKIPGVTCEMSSNNSSFACNAAFSTGPTKSVQVRGTFQCSSTDGGITNDVSLDNLDCRCNADIVSGQDVMSCPCGACPTTGSLVRFGVDCGNMEIPELKGPDGTPCSSIGCDNTCVESVVIDTGGPPTAAPTGLTPTMSPSPTAAPVERPVAGPTGNPLGLPTLDPNNESPTGPGEGEPTTDPGLEPTSAPTVGSPSTAAPVVAGCFYLSIITAMFLW